MYTSRRTCKAALSLSWWNGISTIWEGTPNSSTERKRGDWPNAATLSCVKKTTMMHCNCDYFFAN